MSEHKITVESGATVRLLTAGKYCDRDIVVAAKSNVITVATVADLPAAAEDGTIAIVGGA